MRFVDDIDWVQHGSRAALVCAGQAITYAQLGGAVCRLGARLVRGGVKPGDRVLMPLQKSPAQVAALLAVARIGGVPVPVDPASPTPRRDYIRRVTRSGVALCESDSDTDLLERWGADLDWYPLAGAFEGFSVGSVSAPPPRAPSDLACVLFTSGSTGQPKGVMLRHDGLRRLVDSATAIAGYDSGMRYLNVAPLFFDAALTDVYCTLGQGGTLVLLPSFSFPGELADVMARHQITDALLPTAVLRLLASGFVDLSKHDLRSLKTLWYGGEACPVSVLRRVKEGIPQVRLIHGYGPTETTHTACAMAFDAIPDDAPPVMPIGCPLPGVSAVVIDEHGRRAPTGVVGELYLGGVQVMAGYCGDEARTKSVIVDLPPEVGAPGRHYRTGDFVRVDEGGVFTFVERRDDLVKSRGHLVSLVEVERALLNDVRVSEAYVLATKAPDGSTLLHAVVVLQPSPSRAGAAALASELLKVIPAYAVPHAFSFAQAEEIPSTPQGKTDRRALAERFAGDHAARPGVRAESQRSPSTESRQDA